MTNLSEPFGRLARRLGGTDATNIRRVTGGASQETWLFDVDSTPLVLRRSASGGTVGSITLETEAAVVVAAGANQVPVPGVRHVLDPTDELGVGYVMDHVDGETIPRKILRDDAFAHTRSRLAFECGRVAATIHRTPLTALPGLPVLSARDALAMARQIIDEHGHPQPVFEVALRWLADHLPDARPPTLVHGDFRNGNLMIAPDGIAAVLDWELCHIGDAMEDLGFVCVNSWRFGNIDQPVGGFGSRDQLFSAYEDAGGPPVDPDVVRFWEAMGTLRWGTICLIMVDLYNAGIDATVERAAIGRRVSETEIDLLEIIYGGD